MIRSIVGVILGVMVLSTTAQRHEIDCPEGDGKVTINGAEVDCPPGGKVIINVGASGGGGRP